MTIMIDSQGCNRKYKTS